MTKIYKLKEEFIKQSKHSLKNKQREQKQGGRERGYYEGLYTVDWY